MNEVANKKGINGVSCPYCALLCDDLRVQVEDGSVRVTNNGCELSHRNFGLADPAGDETQPSSQIDGREASLIESVQRAADHLRNASLPLFGGLCTDVNGARAVLSLTERCGGVVDHMNSAALFRNLQVLQDSGWITATLTEIRNRADKLLVVGEKPIKDYPRLLERLVRPKKALFLDPATERELILLGPWDENDLPTELAKLEPTVIQVQMEGMVETAATLRGLIRGAPLQTQSAAGIPSDELASLARWLRAANYAVVVWAAGEFEFPHAELAIQTLCELIRDLNHTSRAAALPLSGNQADLSFNQTCTWQTGYPVRTAFSQGSPHYDPLLYDGRRLLETGETDLLIWVSSLAPDAGPPETDLPTIVLGHPRMGFKRPPEVFIPLGVPGVDHAGHLYRTDGVVALPLKQLRQPTLPSAADVLNQINERI